MRTPSSAPRRRLRRLTRLAMAGWLLTAACSFNQATGRLQLTTVSESEEIELGRQHDEQVVEALGLYEDERLSEMVERIGAQLAAQSERPELPWTFRVLDDPTVNAFALPGGYVYVTRGLMAHLNSEHELASVLGHEIGHVTARHGVVQLRKSRVAAASVGVFRVVDPNLRHVGGLAASTAGLALLKHSRDDEYEADTLGLRYAGRAGFEPAATVGVFDMLMGVSTAERSEKVPDWLSTHPDPELRRERVKSMIEGEAPGPDPEFLARLDGMVYGDDPRDGLLVESTYVYPRGGFRVDLPPKWTASYEGPRVLAGAEDEDAFLVVMPYEAESAEAALEVFFEEGSAERGEVWKGEVGGFPVSSAGLSISTSEGAVMGLVAFIDYEGQVMAMLALGAAEGWEDRSEEVATCFASFRRAEPVLRNIEPMRVRLLKLKKDSTLAALFEARPSAVELPRLALLNGREADALLPAGTVIKWVEGLMSVPTE